MRHVEPIRADWSAHHGPNASVERSEGFGGNESTVALPKRDHVVSDRLKLKRAAKMTIAVPVKVDGLDVAV
jgi:hypothetical protein